MPIAINVSPGEAYDRHAILLLKIENCLDEEQKERFRRQLCALSPHVDMQSAAYGSLRSVNGRLWDLENEVRQLIARQDYGERYIHVTREIHANNDERHRLKRAIGETDVKIYV